jgi:hypothetical protein
MARHGDNDKKRREAYEQHNGWLTGRLKYLASKLKP